MVSLTENQSKVINLLIRDFNKKTSIRMIAKQLGLSPMGAQKILKGFERESVTIKEKIGTGIFYSLNLNNETAFKLGEIILTQNKLNSYAKVYMKNLEKLKPYTKSCVLFGSILHKGEKAGDVDVLVIIDKKDFKKVERKKQEIEKISAKTIQFVYQTQKDLEENIAKRDKAVLEIIRTGAVLWGQNFILKGIKNAI